MEESAQRKERLKAMRMEASQETTTNNAEGSSMFHGLSNPLIETSAAEEHIESSAPQRFDYYTDPMSAFSGTKTRSKVSPQISQDYSTLPSAAGMWNQDVIASAAHQTHINHSPGPGMQPPQGDYGNPAGSVGPTPGFWNGSPGPNNYRFPSNSPRGGNFPSPPAFVQGNNYGHNSGQGRGCQNPNSPRPFFGQENSPTYYSAHGRGPRFNNYNTGPTPGSGRGGYSGFTRGYSPSSDSGQGRGQQFNSNTSPAPNSGRGRGRWSGPSGGRGRGSSNHVTAEERPDLFYNKSMVEDPWKPLTPVIWKTVNVCVPRMNSEDSLYSWLPKSISSKRAKVEDGRGQTSSEPSLAEYLAASFNEAADHEASE